MRPRVLTVAALAAASLLLLAGCGDKGAADASAEPDSTSSQTPAAAEESPTVTAEPTPTETPAEPAPETPSGELKATPGETLPHFDKASKTADYLVAAWLRGDKGDALDVADAQVTEKLFALAVPEAAAPVLKCVEGDDVVAWDCQFDHESGTVHLYLNPDPSTGFRAENLVQSSG